MPPSTPTRINQHPITLEFYAKTQDAASIFELFDYLPQVYVFIKDDAGRFVKVNRGELLLHGCRSDADILGKTDYDFHAPAMARQYIEEDRRILESGQPQINQVWLVLGHDKLPRWYVCTKLPLMGKEGKPVGIAGVMRPYEQVGPAQGDYHRLTPVMEMVLARYSENITVHELAAAAHLSVSQLQRLFQQLFQRTPMAYLQRVRLLIAKRMLEESEAPLGSIALDCGFYDQSHFSSVFKRSLGVSPSAYRAQFSRKAGGS